MSVPHASNSSTESVLLGRHAAAAVGSGLVAALTAAPFITIVDKAITSNASGREPMWTSMANGFKSLISQPGYFFRQPSFRWIAFVYCGTYTVANLVQLGCEYRRMNWQYPKFLATSATNISLSAVKDMAFAKMFAKVGAPARSVPWTSLGLFAGRDSLTIFGSFILPPLLAPLFSSDPATGRRAAQLATPIVMQAFAVPLHLLALDLYNNPAVSTSSRVEFVRREYGKTLVARWARILPAYSIGGVINMELWDVFRRIAGPQPWLQHDATSVEEH
jgi:hypothetical protein